MPKRRVLVFVFLLSSMVCSIAAFAAAQTFMKQFSSAFLVNLASNIYKAHGSSPVWASGSASNPSTNDNYYYDNQMLCTMGISGTTGSVTLTFSLDSGHWLYLLDETDLRFSRPFGVDLIIRGVNRSTGSHESVTINGNQIVHMGLDEDGSSDKSATFVIPSTTWNTYSSIWLDVCLVMDPVLDSNGHVKVGSTTYTVTPTDDNYKARIKVSIDNADLAGGTETYLIDLLGYYTTSGEHPGSSTAILSVTPTAAASSLDIEKLKTDAVVQTVASYSFTTATMTSGVNTNGKVHFFLSSTEGGTGSIDDGFTLKFTRNNKVPSVLNGYNSVKYTARIVSSEYPGQTMDFDGNAVFGNTDNYYSVSADHVSTSTGHGDLTRWHDSGTIEVRITGDIDNLVAGLYTSTIYFHVVTDF